MRINFALVRKEADYFRSRGLHKEAQDLYANFAATSVNIDADIKAAIEAELKLIESEMHGRQAGETPEPSRTSAFAPDEKASVARPEWADGMADIYSLAANEADVPSPAHLEKSVSPAAGPPKTLPMPNPARQKARQRGSRSTLYRMGFVVIAVAAAYSASRFFVSTSDPHRESAQAPATVVYKKVPSFPGDETGSLALSHRPEDPGDEPFEPNAGKGKGRGPSDPAEALELENGSPRPSEGLSNDAGGYSENPAAAPMAGRPSPEEPDPAAAVDYVLKKRRLDR